MIIWNGKFDYNDIINALKFYTVYILIRREITACSKTREPSKNSTAETHFFYDITIFGNEEGLQMAKVTVAAAVSAMSVFECCFSRGTSYWKTCCWHVFRGRPKCNDHITNGDGKGCLHLYSTAMPLKTMVRIEVIKPCLSMKAFASWRFWTLLMENITQFPWALISISI